jgi:hypothetical protein
MPNSKHLTHGISNLVSLITKTKLGLSDGEPTDEEEEAPQAVEEEAPAKEVDNITETIPPGFAPMPRNKKCRLNPPSPNTIMEDEDDSSSE